MRGVIRRSDMRWNSALTVHGIGTQKEYRNVSKTGMPAGPYMDGGTYAQGNAYPAVSRRSAVFLTAKREERVTKTLSETKRLTRALHRAGCLHGKENAPPARRFKTVLDAKQKREDDAYSNTPAIRGRE